MNSGIQGFKSNFEILQSTLLRNYEFNGEEENGEENVDLLEATDLSADSIFKEIGGNGQSDVNTQEDINRLRTNFENYAATNPSVNWAEKAKVDNELNAKKNQIEIEQTATKNALNKEFSEISKNDKHVNDYISIFDINKISDVSIKKQFLQQYDALKEAEKNGDERTFDIVQ